MTLALMFTMSGKLGDVKDRKDGKGQVVEFVFSELRFRDCFYNRAGANRQKCQHFIFCIVEVDKDIGFAHIFVAVQEGLFFDESIHVEVVTEKTVDVVFVAEQLDGKRHISPECEET